MPRLVTKSRRAHTPAPSLARDATSSPPLPASTVPRQTYGLADVQSLDAFADQRILYSDRSKLARLWEPRKTRSDSRARMRRHLGSASAAKSAKTLPEPGSKR